MVSPSYFAAISARLPARARADLAAAAKSPRTRRRSVAAMAGIVTSVAFLYFSFCNARRADRMFKWANYWTVVRNAHTLYVSYSEHRSKVSCGYPCFWNPFSKFSFIPLFFVLHGFCGVHIASNWQRVACTFRKNSLTFIRQSLGGLSYEK